METATRCSSSCIDTLTSMRCETPHIWQDLSSTGSSLTDLCSGLWMLTAVAEQVPICCGALQPVGWLTGCGARLPVCPHYSGLKQEKKGASRLEIVFMHRNPPHPHPHNHCSPKGLKQKNGPNNIYSEVVLDWMRCLRCACKIHW